MKIFYILLLSCFIFLAHGGSQASENKDLFSEMTSEVMLDMLATAKVTGMCGMLKQLTNFQEVTKMEGGDQLILRFMRVEATRLGVTLEVFLENCSTSTSAYNEFVELFKSNLRSVN